ncbi:hypothetical protein SAMN06295912_1218 [Sphingomonas laterariae]|uniref:DUF1214 domain-containing protein n=1 Tax=Edaphosphingomonas laterariae TaxID=861865 RepID=A0A239I2J9_9SPHN|nr:hypothetical protein [Sphingomonas laterariae]SNS87749.1 hypothetical protein SAMN06295912_1218 [Sphingomonas laterariae]
MSDVTTAWARYRRALEEIRARLLELDCAQFPDGEAMVCRLMLEAEAMAYNLVIAPKVATPRLLTQTVFLPGIYDWMLPNPDFYYRYAFVDGSTEHRLTGLRGTSRFLEAQVIAGFFGDPAIKLLETHDLDRMITGDDQIEAVISPEAPAGHVRWIRTEPGCMNTIIIREAFCDWRTESGSHLLLSGGNAATSVDHDIADRLDRARRFLDFAMTTFGPQFCQSVVRQSGENVLTLLNTGRDEDAANPNAAYIAGGFALAPDEALILEFDVPDALYWGIHLGDRWSRTLDYIAHQSSLNGAQVVTESGCRARIIVAHQDPGMPNWLDTGGLERGMILLRWYRAAATPVPEVRLTRLADLVAGSISRDERSGVIEARKKAVLARYRM